jgi:signal peptidase II
VRKEVLPHGVVSMHLVLNPGAVFGFGAHRRDFFIGFTIVVVSVGLALFAVKTTSIDRHGHLGIGLALAGGLGNFYDRLFIGRVRDFIQFAPDLRLPHGWTWPGTNNPEMLPWVFNIADLLLLIGMLMVLGHLRRRRAALTASVATA